MLSAGSIRNIAILGHGSEGKTTLTEAMLLTAGAIDRQGRVEDGTTTSDHDSEETRRQISISASMAPFEWKDYKINIIDVPGYFDFAGEAVGPLTVVESALIVVSASGNSPNIVHACEFAKGLQAPIIALAGFEGGKIKSLADACLIAPLTSYEQIEDVHLAILHMVVCCLKEHQELLA